MAVVGVDLVVEVSGAWMDVGSMPDAALAGKGLVVEDTTTPTGLATLMAQPTSLGDGNTVGCLLHGQTALWVEPSIPTTDELGVVVVVVVVVVSFPRMPW
jgi:hypothetical protein